MGKQIGKVAVLAGNCDGFIGNRMLHPYGREASFLVEEGAQPEDVDRVLYDFGLAMGPFAMGDMAGLDVGWYVRKRQLENWPQGKRYSAIADRICELGRYGQKTGAGWYKYEEGSRVPQPDPVVKEIIEKNSVEAGIKRREISDDEILERCVYALVNEGAKILEEESLSAPSISTSPMSMATPSRNTAAGRCSTRTRWAWTRCWSASGSISNSPAAPTNGSRQR